MKEIQHFQRIKQEHWHIKESTKKSLRDKANHSIKSKCLKWVVKIILSTL